MRARVPIWMSIAIVVWIVSGCSKKQSTTSTVDYSLNARLGQADAQPPENSPTESSVRSGAPVESGPAAPPPAGEKATSSHPPLRNGLFPNWGENAVAQFGGGLFPNLASSGNVASTPNPNAGQSEGRFAPGTGAVLPPESSETGVSAAQTKIKTPKAEPTLSEKLLINAQTLFEQHREEEAVNLLYVHQLVSDEARGQFPLAWYKGLREPRLFFRWGVGIIFNKPRNFNSRHPVIGDPGDPNEIVEPIRTSGRADSNAASGLPRPGGPGATGGTGPAASGDRTYKNVDTSRPDGFLLYFTGDFGEKLISLLEERLEDDDGSYYGSILNHVREINQPDSGDAGDPSKQVEASGAGPAAGSVGAADDSPITGRGAPSSDSGSAPIARADTSVIDRALGDSTAEKPVDDTSGSILPGVMLLGLGSRAEIVERANKAEVDALFLFNVKILQTRGATINVSKMQIVDLETGDNLYNSKSLKDVDVSEDYAAGSDPVLGELEKAFETVCDIQYRAAELPKGLKTPAAEKRVNGLIEKKSENPLKAAVEIVFYLESELLTEEFATTALRQLFGSDGADVLVSGNEQNRLQFLKKWTPRS